MGKTFTTEEYIEKAKTVWGDRFDYSKTIYKGYYEPICIIDKEFNNFEIWVTPRTHLSGREPRHDIKTFKDFIILAELKYPNKYDYSLAEKEFENYSSNKKIPFMEKSTSIVFYQSAKAFLKEAPLCLSTEQFVEIATSIYGNIYDYSEINFVDMTTKVKIFCKKHSKYFSKTPRSFLIEKHGCPYCEQDIKISEDPSVYEKIIKDKTKNFIKRAREVHGDKYDYNEVIYVNSSTPVKIKCIEHNEIFFQSPYNHLLGSTGCEFCIKEKLSISSKSKKTNNTKRLTTEEFIERAKIIHGDKYDYSLVNYINFSTKVEIICKTCGNHFWMTPGNHLYGEQGCPLCAIEHVKITSKKNALTLEEFITRAKEVHGNKYDYSLVEYVNLITPVKIICPIDGVFEQKPLLHLRGSGCQICAQRDLKMSKEVFIRRAKEVHGDKYDYSKVVYINTNTKVEIICPIHGSFWVTPAAHLHGYSCKKCANENKKYSTEEFIEKAREIHGDYYDYSKVIYTGHRKKVEVICPIHGSFFIEARKLLQGKGCPLCNRIISTGENKIKKWLELNNFKYTIYQTFEGLKDKRSLNVDIYLPENNLAIEYQGEHHYKAVQFKGIPKEKAEENFKEVLKHDKIKEEYFKNSNINLLCIHYCDYNNIDEILEKVVIEKDYEYLKNTSSYIF